MRRGANILTEKVRLSPTKTQEAVLWRMSDLARRLYNWALERCGEYYALTGRYKRYLMVAEDLTRYKKEHTEFKYLHSKVAQNAVRRLDSNFRAFFAKRGGGDGTAGPPGFRGGRHFFCLEYNQSGFDVGEDRITLHFNGGENINLTYRARPEFYKREKTIKAVRIHRDAVTKVYYADIVYEAERPKPANDEAIAFDPGVKTLLTGFDGKKVVKYSSRPVASRVKYFGRQLDRVQSKIDQCEKGSKNKERLARVKRKLLRKRNSQVDQILHSYANHIVKRYGRIVVGNWAPRKTISVDPTKGRGNRRINRATQQLPVGKLVGYLAYKGARVEKVDEGETTRRCYNCRYSRKKSVPPAERVMRCPKCGIVVDRDVNAAINIYNRYLAHVTGPPVFPRGGMGCRSWGYAFSAHTLQLQEKPVTFPKGSPRLKPREDVTLPPARQK